MGQLINSYRFSSGGGIASLGTDASWWVKGSDLVGADGAVITTNWLDSSSYGRGLSYASFRKKTAATPTGLPAADFGIYVGNGFACNSLNVQNVFQGTTEGEFWAVCKSPTPSSGGCTNNLWQLQDPVPARSHYPYIDGNVYHGTLRDTRPTVGGLASLIGAWHVMRVSSSAAAWSLEIDGSVKHSSSSGNYAFSTLSVVGGADASNKCEAGTYVAEMVAFKRVLTSGEAAAVLAELTTRNLG